MPSERLFGLACVSIALGVAPAARATYSIAATDGATQEVGGAVTSCVGALDVGVVYGSVPGRGVIHAQAQLDGRARGKNRALELLGQGVAPSEIIAQITQASLDSSFASRQYGIVDVMGRAGGFTGARAQDYKADQQATTGTFTYSVQGNILTSQKVLDQAARAFEGPACDLAERLMRALEAGGANGEGDSRCTNGGIPTDSAFIQVDRPGEPAGSYLRLSVSNTAPQSPLPRLRALFDAWRQTHPCPSMPSASADAGAVDDRDAGADPAPIDAGSPAAGSGAAPRAGAGGSAGNVSGSAGLGAPGTSGSNGASGASRAAAGTPSAPPAATSGGGGSLGEPAPLAPVRDSTGGCSIRGFSAAPARTPLGLWLVAAGVAAVTLRRRVASRFVRSRS